MGIQFNSICRFFIVSFLFLINFFCPKYLFAQNEISSKEISTHDFEMMDNTAKRAYFIQWNQFSSQNEIPVELEQKALAFYKEKNLDERIYHKYKALFRILTNTRLPLSNRINAGHFIMATYDENIFPTGIVKDLLLELAQQLK